MQNNKQLNNSTIILQHSDFEENEFKTFLYKNDCPKKRELERFIRSTFSEHYDAELIHFYPYLFGAYDELNQPYAAVGYRKAEEQRLFLEQYLNSPIEEHLKKISTYNQVNNIQRKHIVEIGNLAANKQGACRKLFQLLTQFFKRSDYQWIVFTGTRTVRVVLKRMRLEAYVIAPAAINNIEATQRNTWGSYYDQDPMVMAIPIKQVLPASFNKLSMTATTAVIAD